MAIRIPTSADKWSLFLPLISGRVGNIRGSALAVDQTTMRPSIILHDPEGTARRNKNTGLAVIGDPGGGKSNRTKLSAFELILRGARAVIFEPDTIAEWKNALTPIAGVRFVDPTTAQFCYDPLVIFPANIAGRIAAAHILPWIGLPHDSILAKRYRRLVRADTRAAHGITSHRALMDYLRTQPGADDDELLLRLETAEEDFPGLFDDTLPPYRPQDSPATVYLTGNLALPDADDLTNAELYNKLSGPQRAGMAIYGLLIELEQRYMFDRLDVFDVMIFEECAELCAFTTTARIAHKITRRGRKHATGIWLITQDYRDLAPMGDKFITQKWIFRVQDPELAYATLKWARIDPDMYPQLVSALSEDTSPGNTADEDVLSGDEWGHHVIEAGAVDPHRLGEGFAVDELDGPPASSSSAPRHQSRPAPSIRRRRPREAIGDAGGLAGLPPPSAGGGGCDDRGVCAVLVGRRGRTASLGRGRVGRAGMDGIARQRWCPAGGLLLVGGRHHRSHPEQRPGSRLESDVVGGVGDQGDQRGDHPRHCGLVAD